MPRLADIPELLNLRSLDQLLKIPDAAIAENLPETEVIKLRGIVVGRDPKNIGLVVSNRLLVIPIAAIQSVTKEKSEPAEMPDKGVAVSLVVGKQAMIGVHHLVRAVELGSSTGTLPLVLSKASESKAYSVPTAAVAARERARQAAIEQDGHLDPWKSIVSEVNIPSILKPLDMDTIQYSSGTAKDTTQTQIHDCPFDTVDSRTGLSATSTDYKSDSTVVSESDFNSDVVEVKAPYHSVATAYENKSWKAIDTPFETKKSMFGVSSSSQDYSHDFSTDTSTAYNSDLENPAKPKKKEEDA